jgi:hypothetical protein
MPDSPESAAPPTKAEMPGKEQSVAAVPSSRWQRYVTPVLVILLALAVFVTLSGTGIHGRVPKRNRLPETLRSAEIPELANNLRPGLSVNATVRTR